MMAVDATVQSLPSMFAGGLVGRGVGKFAGIQNGAVRAGIGEGVIGAGSVAENMRSENEDGLLTGKQIAGSMAIGGATGLLGYGGGRFAEKLGIADADTLLAGGVRTASQTGEEIAQNTAKGLSGWKGSVAGVGKGALAEGVLEELPQTIAETALDNWANDRALSENMAGNAAIGLASGGLMGGTIGGISGWRGKGNNDNNQNPPPNSIIPEEYVPTSPNGGGSTAVDVDEHGNIIAKPTNAMSDETALTPMQERWADQSRMIDDSTERQGFQGGLLENKGTPILDRNIALDNGTILRAGDPNAYNEWLAYEREQAAAKRDENIHQGVNDITPVPTEAVAYGLASNLNNHQGVSTPLLEFSQSVVDRMTQNGVDVHALAGSQDKQAQLTDILRSTDPRTFTNPQSFDNWVAQNEYINQFKAGNQNHGLVQSQKPSEQLGLNPNQGSLTRSAVVAVDSGASPVGQALQQSTAGQTQPTPQIEGLSAYQAQRAKQQQTQAQNEQIAKEVFVSTPKLIGKQNYTHQTPK